MHNKITMTQMMEASKKLNANGRKFTHIGVGPTYVPQFASRSA